MAVRTGEISDEKEPYPKPFAYPKVQKRMAAVPKTTDQALAPPSGNVVWLNFTSGGIASRDFFPEDVSRSTSGGDLESSTAEDSFSGSFDDMVKDVMVT